MKVFVNKVLVFGLIAGATASCGKEPSSVVHWYYENKSGKDIVVIDTKRSDKEPVSIPNGTTYYEISGGRNGIGPFDNAINIDVIFNNERIINYDIYDNRDAFNSPFNGANYIKVTIKDEEWYDEYAYYYTFVPEQYDMAEPYNPEDPEPEE